MEHFSSFLKEGFWSLTPSLQKGYGRDNSDAILLRLQGGLEAFMNGVVSID